MKKYILFSLLVLGLFISNIQAASTATFTVGTGTVNRVVSKVGTAPEIYIHGAILVVTKPIRLLSVSIDNTTGAAACTTGFFDTGVTNVARPVITDYALSYKTNITTIITSPEGASITNLYPNVWYTDTSKKATNQYYSPKLGEVTTGSNGVSTTTFNSGNGVVVSYGLGITNSIAVSGAQTLVVTATYEDIVP